jgi:ATP/ADP translocase
MKVSYSRKNMMNQEFQHYSESQLIEVMILKMHPIQFGLIVNLIQMKWMKMIYTSENITNQEFQYHEELRYETSQKSYESICDQHHQAEKFC